jgi:glycine/D-amino acid oxidase-like deaminating enzyme
MSVLHMPRIRYGVPLWLDRVPSARRPSYPRYKGDSETDVVIVGGGLAGCLAAYTFRKAGIRVTLLEADRVGLGSAASLGWMPEHPGVPFRALQDAHGLRSARKIWEASRKSALDAAALLRRLAIRCDLTKVESVLVARDNDQLLRVKREHQAIADAGLDAVLVNARKLTTELRAEELLSAIRTKNDAVCDPYRACTGLAAAASKAKALIFEHSAVVKVKAGRKQVEVKTAGGTIIANTVIMATNEPGPGCAALRRHVRVTDTYAVATPPLTGPLMAPVAKALGKRDVVMREAAGIFGPGFPGPALPGVEPPHVLLHTKDGRILFSGADQKPVAERLAEKAIIQRTGQLMYELSRLYPMISGTPPEYGWSGRAVTATDGLLLAGPHRNFPRHLFALGLGATGISGAFLAARILLRYYQETADQTDELFGFGRVQPVRG